MMRLTFYPRPMPNESIGSVMLRACGANIATPINMMEAIGQPITSITAMLVKTLNAETTALSVVAHLEHWQTPVVLVRLLHAGQFQNWITYTNGKFCPICASEGSLPWIHDFDVVNVCMSHQCELTSHCSACQKPMSWNRLGLNCCACGHDVIAATPAAANMLVRGGIIEEWIGSGRFKQLEAYIELETLLAERYEEFSPDPDALKLFIDSQISKFAVVMAQIQRRLGGLPLRAALAPLACATSELIHSQVSTLLVKIAELDPICSAHDLLSDNHLSHAEPITAPDTKPTTTDGLAKPSLNTFYLSRQELIFVTGAKPSTTDKLIAHYTDSSFIKQGRTRRLTIDSLLHFYRALSPAIASDNGVSLKTIGNKYKLSMGELLKSIVNGELRTTRFHADLCIADIEVEDIFSETDLVPEGYMTLKQVENYLHSYGEAVRNLVSVGFLPTCKKERNNRYLLLASEVHAFHKKFVLPGELAAQVNASLVVLSEKLISSGIHPKSGPAVDDGLIYVFRRADLKNVNLKMIFNDSDYKSLSGRKQVDSVRYDSEEWANSAETAAELNISTQRLTQFVALGLLVLGKPVGVPSAQTRYFRRDSISRAKVYINSLVDINYLAAQLEITVHHLNQRIKNLLQKESILHLGRNYISAQDADLLKNHCDLYWGEKTAANYLGVTKSDINNWNWLGHLSRLGPQDDGYIDAPKLYKRQDIVALKNSLLITNHLERCNARSNNSR